MPRPARLIGINHVALEVGDVDQALDFYDPWGNRVQVVEYGDIQFERTPGVKRKLGIQELGKSEDALRQIEERGLA